MARTFDKDYQIGKEGERMSFAALKDFFGDDLKWSDDIFAPWDFTSSCVVLEQKTRTISSKKHPTTLMNLLKVMRAVQETRPAFFIFRFTDGLYYIKHNADKFSEYQLLPMTVKGRDVVDKEDWRYHIPIEDLTLLQAFQDCHNCHKDLQVALFVQ